MNLLYLHISIVIIINERTKLNRKFQLFSFHINCISITKNEPLLRVRHVDDYYTSYIAVNGKSSIGRIESDHVQHGIYFQWRALRSCRISILGDSNQLVGPNLLYTLYGHVINERICIDRSSLYT